MSFLSNLISAKVALNLVKNQIEKELKRKIDNYSIIVKNNKIDFIIDNEKYNYNNNQIRSALETQVKSKLKKGQTLDLIYIDVKKDSNPIATVCITDKGIKEKKTYKL